MEEKEVVAAPVAEETPAPAETPNNGDLFFRHYLEFQQELVFLLQLVQ